jgi:hypothetical protein
VLRRQRRREEGVQALEQAIRVNPQNETVRSNVLGVRHTRGRQYLTEPTRELIADDTRARRFNPSRWDTRRAKRLRPWWWLALKRVPAPVALLVNAAILALTVSVALKSSKSLHDVLLWLLISGVALPASIRRAWRWWRIKHPPASSWTPTQPDRQQRQPRH